MHYEKRSTGVLDSLTQVDPDHFYTMLRSALTLGSYGTEKSLDTACGVLSCTLSNKLIRRTTFRGLCYALCFLSKDEIEGNLDLIYQSWKYDKTTLSLEEFQNIWRDFEKDRGLVRNTITEVRFMLDPRVVNRLVTVGCPPGIYVRLSGVSIT
jgi:hypothetical protein